ncbi:MAG: M14-type cytosolic carboxypeptidase [Polyangiaceae bacterium]
MDIHSRFDAGKIEVLSARDPRDIRLAIPADNAASEHRQWFAFRAPRSGGQDRLYRIMNAGECTYADAFEDYQACASYDGEHWFRVPTELENGELRITHCAEADEVTYAYFAPYPRARHRQLMQDAAASGAARIRNVGFSVEREAMTVLDFGEVREETRKLWIVAHQHPGEPMGAWFAEGLIQRLMNDDDELVRELLERASIHVVQRMNPDGATRGNHRTNAAGLDLNRMWWEADEEKSPEVVAVRKALYETGVDFFLDVHGDEHQPHVFLAGAEGNPHYTDRIEELEDAFSNAMLEANGDFQTEEGYPKDAPGKGDLRCASNYTGEAFDCLSLTLEMPFKDDADAPDPEVGWSPERCRKLGADTLEAMLAVVDDLR